MSPPKRIPFTEQTPENQKRLLEFWKECERIDKDPVVLAKHAEWLKTKPWPIGVSPIIVAQLEAYSIICLDHTVANVWREAFLKGKPLK